MRGRRQDQMAAIGYYIKRNLPLLRRIDEDERLREWCRQYANVYTSTPDEFSIERQLEEFLHDAYECGLVPSGYRDTYDGIRNEDLYTRKPNERELARLSADQLISVIAMQFRHDHFSEGVLFGRYVADGIMLPYLEELGRRTA